MTYLQDKKRKRDRFIKFFLVTSASIVFVFGVANIKIILAPFAKGLFGTGGKVFDGLQTGVSSNLTTKSSLQKKVSELESENQRLKTKEENYLIQEEELQAMRQALALKDELPIKSHATTKSNRSIYGTFIVEGNGQVDLNQNDIVVDRFGSALGLVTDTSNGKTNVVGLDALKDPIDLTLLNGQISLKTIGLSRYVLVAKIPRETEIEVGDVAIVTGTNIKVGSVVDFSKDEKEPFKEVYIRMSGKIERAQVVGIIANN